MRERIEIFDGSNLSKLQAEINEWLDENDVELVDMKIHDGYIDTFVIFLIVRWSEDGQEDASSL